MEDTIKVKPETVPAKTKQAEAEPEKTAKSASLNQKSTNCSNTLSAIAIIVASCAIVLAIGFGAQLNILVQKQQKTIDMLTECLSIHQNTSDELEQLKVNVSNLAATIHHSTETLPIQNLANLSDRVSLLENKSRDHLTDLINNHRLWVNDTIETLIELYEQLQTLVDENTQEIRHVDNTTRGLLHRLEATLGGAIEELANASYRNFTQLEIAIDTLAGSVNETNEFTRALQSNITNITANVTQLKDELDAVRQELNYDSELEVIGNNLAELSREVSELKSGAQIIAVTNTVVFLFVLFFTFLI